MLDANYALTPTTLKAKLYAASSFENFGTAGKDQEYGYGLILPYNAVKSAAGARTGSFSDGVSHIYRSGNLAATGAVKDWALTVSSTARPIAVTMIVQEWLMGSDFDVYLYNPSGILVAYSNGETRQETISFRPLVTGTYRIRVRSFSGAGGYYLDIAYR
jgi:serine protease AprX